MTEAGATKAKTGALLGAGATLSFLAGFVVHRFMSDSPLPLETFDWILRNGDRGLYLAVALVIGIFYVQERRERTRSDERRAADLREQGAELRALLRKLTRVLAIVTEVIRGHMITERELGEISDTPDDPGTKLPEKKHGP